MLCLPLHRRAGLEEALHGGVCRGREGLEHRLHPLEEQQGRVRPGEEGKKEGKEEGRPPCLVPHTHTYAHHLLTDLTQSCLVGAGLTLEETRRVLTSDHELMRTWTDFLPV